MRKMLVFLLIVGVLIGGTFSIVEDVCEKAAQETEFFNVRDIEGPGDEGAAPCGGGQGGAGAPG